MWAFLECVAQAVMGKGVRGLCELVPGGPYIFDVAGDAYRLFREQRRTDATPRGDAKSPPRPPRRRRGSPREVAREVAADGAARGPRRAGTVPDADSRRGAGSR